MEFVSRRAVLADPCMPCDAGAKRILKIELRSNVGRVLMQVGTDLGEEARPPCGTPTPNCVSGASSLSGAPASGGGVYSGA